MAKTLILFLDESGSDNLDKIDPKYLILGVGGPIFEEEAYYKTESERIKQFKRNVFGSDKINLRLADNMRAQIGPFACIADSAKYAQYIAEFVALINDLQFSFISQIIDPTGHKNKYFKPHPPYELIKGFVMDSFSKILFRENAVGKIYAERRGSKPNNKVREAYKLIKQNGTAYVKASQTRAHFPEDIHFYD